MDIEEALIEKGIRGVSLLRVGFVVSIVGYIILAVWILAIASSIASSESLSVSRLVASVIPMLSFAFFIGVVSSVLMIKGFRNLCDSQGYGCIVWKFLAAMLILSCIAFPFVIWSMLSLEATKCSDIYCLARVARSLNGLGAITGILSTIASFAFYGSFYVMGKGEGIESLEIGGIAGIILAFVSLCASIAGSNLAIAVIEFVLAIVTFIAILMGLGEYRERLKLQLVELRYRS